MRNRLNETDKTEALARHINMEEFLMKKRKAEHAIVLQATNGDEK